ncbi:MAG: phosphate ABC transporter substrate-binding/OmpA family protein [Yoonia sp.]|uniref:phosphate ABC transporter substrate-binding/OmpA family protein n=1 Tax=Yoonia sp. TaxID=2212373 RepID=UPI003EF2A0D0
MKTFKSSAAVIALTAGLLFPQATLAQDVTLRSTDGSMSLDGQLLGVEEGNYVIRTTLGDLRVATSSMICEGAGCPSLETVSADVTIVGSEAIGLGMMPLLMSGFASSLAADAEINNPSASETVVSLIGDDGFGDEIGSYKVSSVGDDAAFRALLEGDAQVGMSSRRITQDEARALRDSGAGSMVSPNQERIIAVDSMVVVTHADNPVNELTQDQLSAIFSGQITNWSQVGGPDRDINVIAHPEDSASYQYFMNFLYGDDTPNFRPQGIAEDDQALSNVMFHDRNAIGYLGYAFQRGAKPLRLVNECGISTSPDAFSAKTEEYTLSRRMYLYNRGDNLDDQAQAFLDFAISDEADNVIGKSGFIDLGIARRAQTAEDARYVALSKELERYDIGFEGEIIGNMLREMEDYDRLSTTFRFRTGSSRIDERGRLDMDRLIEYLEDMPAGTQVMFVGFTDDVGPFDANQRLAEERAKEVIDAVEDTAGDALAGIEMIAAGYGEIAPSACNISDRGRAINRRVEVWINEPAAG